MSRITIGNVEIVAFVDIPFELPWGMVFPGKTDAEIQPYRNMYPAATGRIGASTQAGAYALRSGGKTVLCDTGLGPGPIDFLGGKGGRLLDDMRDKGVDPASVDVVIMTHLHSDHVGWNLDKPTGKPHFPNARYLVPQADWDFFTAALAANPQMEQVTPLEDLGLLELITGDVAVTSEITTHPTPGHTPGHLSLLVTSSGEKALVTGDVAHHPAQVDRTDWSPVFDTDSAASSNTRARIMEVLEAEGMTAAFCHFPEPFGRIVRLDGKRVFQAI
jgi:glyoxylase-like metal-dependent hydrolase (beta-lactamase superfamily II)